MTKQTTKMILSTVLAFAGLALVYLVFAGRFALRTASGSVSRSLCAAAFVSQVDPQKSFNQEQLPEMRSIGWAMRYRVDPVKREVRTTVFGTFATRAVYRPGLGCLLLQGDAAVPEAAGLVLAARDDSSGADVVTPADVRLRRALDLAFAEPDPAHPRQTKAVVIWHKGELVAERYATGYGPQTQIWAHSISKSITNALIGILVQQGKLQLDQPAPIDAWRTHQDPHHAITVDQLLRMTSGLPFDETSGALNPMSRMLFLQSDMAGYASQTPLAHAPGTAWGYSNLGYVLLGRLIRNASGGNGVDAERFMQRELFDPLAMHHTLMETDTTGTPIAASQVYSTARDLARFGQLYLDDGMVNGRRILPEGWVAYSHSQTLKTGYGAGFWTNLVDTGDVPVWDTPWGMPELPRDTYYARGALGQYVVIVPSEHLVVVRLGISPYYGTDIGNVVASIIGALHQLGEKGR